MAGIDYIKSYELQDIVLTDDKFLNNFEDEFKLVINKIEQSI